jgi:hypothetical protein
MIRQIGPQPLPPVVMEEMTDPVEIAQFRARQEMFDRNWEWFKTQIPDVYEKHRGKCYCVAGQELFVGDTPEIVMAKAKAAHPDDGGRFTGYIPRVKAYRIYAINR